jgi:hypothetical protein
VLAALGQVRDLALFCVFGVEEGGRFFRNLIALSLYHVRFGIVARQRRNKLVSPASCSDLRHTCHRTSLSSNRPLD